METTTTTTRTRNYNYRKEVYHRVLVNRAGRRMYCTDALGEPNANYLVYGWFVDNGESAGTQLAECWTIDEDQSIPERFAERAKNSLDTRY